MSQAPFSSLAGKLAVNNSPSSSTGLLLSSSSSTSSSSTLSSSSSLHSTSSSSTAPSVSSSRSDSSSSPTLDFSSSSSKRATLSSSSAPVNTSSSSTPSSHSSSSSSSSSASSSSSSHTHLLSSTSSYLPSPSSSSWVNGSSFHSSSSSTGSLSPSAATCDHWCIAAIILLTLLSLGLIAAVYRLYRSSTHRPPDKLPQAVPAATPRVTRPTRSRSTTTLLFPTVEAEEEYDPHNINSTAQYSPVTPVLQANPWQPQPAATLQPMNGRRVHVEHTSYATPSSSNGVSTPTSVGSVGSSGGSGEKRKKKKKRVLLNGATNGTGMSGSDREPLLSSEERKEANRESRLMV